MADYTHKQIDAMEAIAGGAFKRARAELGVSAFGMQVIDLPGGVDRYPEHDHAESGQEEVYVTLDGSGVLDVDGESVPLDIESMVRVGAESRRKVTAGHEGLRLLVLGATPGAVYEAPEFSELGTADPFA
ncbi:MAG: hypothetical protein ACJ762_07305 [Solirubrobacteraceae bacterium]